jgi:hypothetical protein
MKRNCGVNTISTVT